MRLDFHFSISLDREHDQPDHAPEVDVKGSTILERADPHPEPDRPIGFTRGDDR